MQLYPCYISSEGVITAEIKREPYREDADILMQKYEVSTTWI